MAFSRAEALMTAHRLRRTLASAPDPRRQAQALYTELVHTEGWDLAEQRRILAYGSWLAGRPALADLKPAIEKLLSKLN